MIYKTLNPKGFETGLIYEMFILSSSFQQPFHHFLFCTISSSSPSPLLHHLLFLSVSSFFTISSSSPSLLHHLLIEYLLFHHLFFSLHSSPLICTIFISAFNYYLVHNPVSPYLILTPHSNFNSFLVSLAL